MLSTVPSTRVSRVSLVTPAGDEAPPEAALRLMEAAAAAFAEKGFHATTTRDIASRAGLSPAGVYVHFASKEDLLFQISRKGHLVARDILVHAAAASDTPTDAIRRIATVFSTWHAEHYTVARIVQYEFPHLTHEHREVVLGLRKEIDRVVRDVLDEGVASGEFDVRDVPGTALAILSMAVDVARWYDPQIRRTPESIGEAYGEYAVRLVSARRE
jgi:AcrR family transcriptional regulator